MQGMQHMYGNIAYIIFMSYMYIRNIQDMDWEGAKTNRGGPKNSSGGGGGGVSGPEFFKGGGGGLGSKSAGI